MLIVAALTVIGVALRLVVARQSLFGDEISTHWIVSGNDLPGVVSTVHTDAEITPPLYFVASWLATRIDLTPELLRAPSLIAGAAAIPLVYALGLRTVGRRAALVATALTALSPFMIFYSAEARGYELMVVLVLLSTLALLAAIDGRRTLWWVAYAVCACAAVYTHYTAVFALAGQLLWALWAHPEARRPALVASVAAAVAFLPWLSGLRGDLNSTTTEILSLLQPFELRWIRTSVTHWAIGHPFAGEGTGLRDLPGVPGLVLFALGAARRARGDRPRARVAARARPPRVARRRARAVGAGRRGDRERASARTCSARATSPRRGRRTRSASRASRWPRAGGSAPSRRASCSRRSRSARRRWSTRTSSATTTTRSRRRSSSAPGRATSSSTAPASARPASRRRCASRSSGRRARSSSTATRSPTTRSRSSPPRRRSPTWSRRRRPPGTGCSSSRWRARRSGARRPPRCRTASSASRRARGPGIDRVVLDVYERG